MSTSKLILSEDFIIFRKEVYIINRNVDLTKLKNKRLETKSTQKQIGEYLGISDRHYSAMERGARKISLETANALAIFFNTTIDNLFIN
jgi:DNA-binding XRE family transcriptional regulator